MFSVKPLADNMGAMVSDIDLSRVEDRETFKQLLSVFYDHGVLVVRSQNLDLAQFQRIGSYFGRPKPHFLDHLRMPGFDSILLLSNVHENGRPIGVYEGAAFWHTDVAYEDPPNTSTVVYAVEVPESGGRTWFANQYAA